MIEIYDGKAPKIAQSAFIHPAAHIIGDVEIGENSIVWSGAVVRGDVGAIKIGNFVMIDDNSVLHAGSSQDLFSGPQSPLHIGDNVIIGHGAVVHGKRIGNNVLIGINACVLEDAEIEDYCVIAAGAVVMGGARIPTRSFVTGVPGKIKGEVSEKQVVWVNNREEHILQKISELRQQRPIG